MPDPVGWTGPTLGVVAGLITAVCYLYATASSRPRWLSGTWKSESRVASVAQQTSNLAFTDTKLDTGTQSLMTMKSFPDIHPEVHSVYHQYERMRKDLYSLNKKRQMQMVFLKEMEGKLRKLQLRCRSFKRSCRCYLSQLKGHYYQALPRLVNYRSTGDSKLLSTLNDATTEAPWVSRNIRDSYHDKETDGYDDAHFSGNCSRATSVGNSLKFMTDADGFNKTVSRGDVLINEETGLPGRRSIRFDPMRVLGSKRLFWSARQYAKKNNYAFCWMSNGNVFVRKKEGEARVLLHTNSACKNCADLQSGS